ncbi:MAG: hypothetical protein Q7U52_10645 [Hydrogenophaga sp.]|uniref:hypothetical protein n=1 Tax=Hydrogenophaga sp. TaxID=1904254 RepID=UPI002726B44A|nr:hypothetical protein [Hydrogenophaga sp.]MDO9148106.1 hypothetical protein [Hydrogenophaga sp.]MDO9603730.1 hypothetical protein [Hydrogenophaga sp.]MDP2166444.1 hypothetical protein [Hydrogenophaga sp.]MDP3475362.1 hypothetical protein [Hydrogenophaga sp.]
MKLNLTGGILFLLLGPAVADPAAERKLGDPIDASVVVVPTSIDDEPRTALRLRELLRQPFDRVEDPFEPYRLSVEERQRMREQLRSQSSYANHKK